jgi:hypothetical protein
VPAVPLIASLEDGEAVLEFPYDERLRQLLRAIPGRRWDPQRRAWRIPLDGERAAALSGLLAHAGLEVKLSDKLARAISRSLARRDRRECVIDLARPDADWWLSFSSDAPREITAVLLGHPCAYRIDAIGRSLLPLDEQALTLVGQLRERACALRLTRQCEQAIDARVRATAAHREDQPGDEVELRRDTNSRRWIIIAAEHAPLARVLAANAGLPALDGPEGALGVQALERDAQAIGELLDELEPRRIDPRVERWLSQARRWDGTVDVAGDPTEPVFLLQGDTARLPRPLYEQLQGADHLPITLANWRVIKEHLAGQLSSAARRCAVALERGWPLPPAVLERSVVHEAESFVLAPGHQPALLELFTGLAGTLPPKPPRRHAHEHALLPAIHADPFCVPSLDAFLAEHGVWVDPAALELLQEIRERHARSAGVVALSAAREDDLEIPGLGGQLKPFQRAGVSYLLSQRRAFLADEQGLGKTIQAIAALEADDAYPAIIVCPASLKLNWLAELAGWIPHRTVEVLGAGAAGAASHAQVIVVNYDIVARRMAALCAVKARALVLDESHYCKNARAKRTRAVARLASNIAPDGLVLALTGTPVMNNPPELVSQLRILGRLGDFGSGAAFSRRFSGPDAHVRLHWHLRARCFARRLKSEVLTQLPAKTRSIVPIELDNQPEYSLAERDVLAWLRSQPLDLRELNAKVAAALRAERLVRLNALKLLAARGKLQAALAWIHDFLSTGERLVVFARHREIQRAVLERYPGAAHILGCDSPRERDQAVRAFQQQTATAPQLIVCSMEVAAQGLTLTRASNVAFLELDWTPARHDQAEDRCHRIGQKDAVNAYYLLAADTIDETIARLLEQKRAVIAAVTDGQAEDDQPLLEQLIAELRAAPYRHLRAVA